MVIRVKGNMNVSSRVWFSENDFRRVLVGGYLFHWLGVTGSFPQRIVVDKVKYVYCCVTSVDFICSVPLYRTVDTSEVNM